MDDERNNNDNGQTASDLQAQLAELIKKTGGVVPPVKPAQPVADSPKGKDFGAAEPSNPDAGRRDAGKSGGIENDNITAEMPETAGAPSGGKTLEEIDAEIEALINGINSGAPQDGEGAAFSAPDESAAFTGDDPAFSEAVFEVPPAAPSEPAIDLDDPAFAAFDPAGFGQEQPPFAPPPVEAEAEGQHSFGQTPDPSLDDLEAEIAALEAEMAQPVTPPPQDFEPPFEPQRQESFAIQPEFSGMEQEQPAGSEPQADDAEAELQALIEELEASQPAPAQEDTGSARSSEGERENIVTPPSEEGAAADDLSRQPEAAAEERTAAETAAEAGGDGETVRQEHIEIVPPVFAPERQTPPVDVGRFDKIIDKLAETLGGEDAPAPQNVKVDAQTEGEESGGTERDYAAMEAELEALLKQDSVRSQEQSGSGGNEEVAGELQALRAKIAALETALNGRRQSEQTAAETARPTSDAATTPPPQAAPGDVNAMFKQWFDLEMAAKMKNIISEDEKKGEKKPPQPSTYEIRPDMVNISDAQTAAFNSDFVKLSENVYYNVKEKKAYMLQPVGQPQTLPAVLPQKKTVKRRPAARPPAPRRRRRPAGLARPRRPRRPFPRRPGMR